MALQESPERPGVLGLLKPTDEIGAEFYSVLLSGSK